VGFDFSAEVARIPLASEHGLALLGLQNAPDRGRQSIPLGGFFYELLAAGRCQRIKPRLAVICGDSPFRGNPAALLQPLERGVKRSVLHQKLLIRRLLDGARDPLAVLRSKNQRAQNQQVQGALQQFEPFSCFLGRHITRTYDYLGKMSTQKSGAHMAELFRSRRLFAALQSPPPTEVADETRSTSPRRNSRKSLVLRELARATTAAASRKNCVGSGARALRRNREAQSRVSGA